jgi:pyruvate/2-oxoglutarate dehydrogenase complex dihydrolipoamide dehydrogenase (E3) component
MSRQFEAIVVGSGQAGPSLAVRLADAGLRTALIERDRLGGTCVNNGCLPTKTLIASARSAYMARRAGQYGVNIPGPIEVDMKAVKARKDSLVDASRTSLGTWLEGRTNLTLIFAEARFVGPHTLTAGEEVLEAPRIFINVGGRPTVPNWPGLAEVPVLTSTSMMDVDYLPEHLLVVGGSYIGLEFAQMYRRFGSRVTVIEYADRLIPREDLEVSETVRTCLEEEGLTFHLAARDVAASRAGNGIRLAFRINGDARSIDGSHLLLAVGRRPNTENLGLEAAGVAIDANGFIPVDEELRTNVESIWALGDCNGRGAFTHTAYNDYEIVAANLLDGGTRRLSQRIPAYALFTDPPLGRIGMSEAEVRANGRKALVATLPMTRVGRAKERGETKGFMKVLVDAESKRILGAAFLCAEGDEIVQSLLNVMACDAPVTAIQRTMYIHPTISELIPTLLGSLTPLDRAA